MIFHLKKLKTHAAENHDLISKPICQEDSNLLYPVTINLTDDVQQELSEKNPSVNTSELIMDNEMSTADSDKIFDSDSNRLHCSTNIDIMDIDIGQIGNIAILNDSDGTIIPLLNILDQSIIPKGADMIHNDVTVEI